MIRLAVVGAGAAIRQAAMQSVRITVIIFFINFPPYIANAIHLICDPLAQHLEEPLVRSLKELAVI